MIEKKTDNNTRLAKIEQALTQSVFGLFLIVAVVKLFTVERSDVKQIFESVLRLSR